MEFYIDNIFSILSVLGSALFALVLVFIQYKSANDEMLERKQKYFLAGIRFLCIFVLTVLLAGIAIKHIQSKRVKPIFIIASDHSKSILAYENDLNEFLNRLSNRLEDVELEFWQFGEHAEQLKNENFSDNESNYSDLLKTLNENYLGSTIGAVLLLGDGIVNTGTDPILQSKTFPFPIYTVGLGDTTQHIDAAIKEVNTNPSTFIDTYFPVEFGVDFEMIAGQQATIQILQGNKLIHSKDYQIHSDHQFIHELVNIKAETAGLNNFQLLVSGIENEQNTNNNSYEFSINVASEKKNILIVGSGPHPDIAAIKNALKSKPNYTIDIKTGPGSKFSLDDYDLIIAHQIPNINKQFIPLQNKLQQSNIPTLYLIGEQSSLTELNASQTYITLPSSPIFEEVSSAFNPQFNLFTLSPELEEACAYFPPLSSPFGDITFSSDMQSLFYQKIKNIQTSNPLISLSIGNNMRKAFVCGEGIWRWRIYDFLKTGNHNAFDKLIHKITNYLIVKSDKNGLTVYFPPIFKENELITLQADLYNKSNELINFPDVELEISTEDSTQYTYSFDKYEQAYRLNAGKLPVGNYTYEAKTHLGKNKLSQKGSFRISSSQKELLETRANFHILNQLAQNTGGKFFLPQELDLLLDHLNENQTFKRIKVKLEKFQDLLDMKWLFIFIVILLSMEWFLRKYWGTY